MDNLYFKTVVKHLLSKHYLTDIEKICWEVILIDYMKTVKDNYRDNQDPHKKFNYFYSVGSRLLELWFKERKEERIGVLSIRYNSELRDYNLNKILKNIK